MVNLHYYQVTCMQDISNVCTMCARDLTNICAQGLRAEGVYISQVTSTHGMDNMYHLFVHIVCGRMLMHD